MESFAISDPGLVSRFDTVPEAQSRGPGSPGLRFLHAADLHLGAPLRLSSAELDGGRAAGIRTSAMGAWGRLVDTALTSEVEFVVIAGDVFDTAEREVAAYARFESGLRSLSEAGISTYLALGNHDPVPGFRPVRALPSAVHIFDSESPSHFVHHGRNGEEVHLLGQSYGSRSEPRNLVAEIATCASGIAGDGRRIIGVVHTNLGADNRHGNYAPSTLADLRGAVVDYWALGHVHSRRVGEIGSGRWWAYPGNLQGRGLSAFELGPKGALLVDIAEGGGFREPRFVACAGVEFQRFETSVPPTEDTDVDLDEALFTLADEVHAMLRRNASSAEVMAVDLALSVRPEAGELLSQLREVDAAEGLVARCQAIFDSMAIPAVLVRAAAQLPLETISPQVTRGFRQELEGVLAETFIGAPVGGGPELSDVLRLVRSLVPEAVSAASQESPWGSTAELFAEIEAELRLELRAGECHE